MLEWMRRRHVAGCLFKLFVDKEAEKAGGDSVQPMGNLVGMAMSGGSQSRFGNGTVSLRALDGVSGSW